MFRFACSLLIDTFVCPFMRTCRTSMCLRYPGPFFAPASHLGICSTASGSNLSWCSWRRLAWHVSKLGTVDCYVSCGVCSLGSAWLLTFCFLALIDDSMSSGSIRYCMADCLWRWLLSPSWLGTWDAFRYFVGKPSLFFLSLSATQARTLPSLQFLRPYFELLQPPHHCPQNRSQCHLSVYAVQLLGRLPLLVAMELQYLKLFSYWWLRPLQAVLCISHPTFLLLWFFVFSQSRHLLLRSRTQFNQLSSKRVFFSMFTCCQW